MEMNLEIFVALYFLIFATVGLFVALLLTIKSKDAKQLKAIPIRTEPLIK